MPTLLGLFQYSLPFIYNAYINGYFVILFIKTYFKRMVKSILVYLFMYKSTLGKGEVYISSTIAGYC